MTSARAAAANDRLWALIRDGLRAERDRGARCADPGRGRLLARTGQAPDLVLSQTCGYPYRARLHGRVTYVGTPDYGVEGCAAGPLPQSSSWSAPTIRAQTLADFDGARFAYNEALSQSGWAAPQTHAARLGIRLPPALQTGGHRLSALAVAEGRADIAALDAVTWRAAAALRPTVAQACGWSA